VPSLEDIAKVLRDQKEDPEIRATAASAFASRIN
jgi:hypothetical protein